jgi:type III restriction enzyme
LAEAADPESLVEDLIAELEKLSEFQPGNEGREGLPSTPALQRFFTSGELRKIAGSLDRDGWLTIALTPLEDVPVFSYRSREDQYIPFDFASAGQQATALLKTLLNQAGPPLIIDQPEEDLDNPVILEVVEQIWAAKARRQIVFASHNANLVVNGDAELVIWCDHRTAADQSRGKIAGEGAIDVPAIRDAITSVMEGGQDAFNLRMQKYGF